MREAARSIERAGAQVAPLLSSLVAPRLCCACERLALTCAQELTTTTTKEIAIVGDGFETYLSDDLSSKCVLGSHIRE